jgi:hypothetical protein
MNFSLVAALSAALVACVLALAREMRLRRALQRLLAVILTRWRTHLAKPQSPDSLDPHNDRNQRL